MFTHSRTTSRFSVGRLIGAAMLLVLLGALTLVPPADTEASAYYVVTEDDHMHVDEADETIFLTTAVSLKTGAKGNEVRLQSGQPVQIRVGESILTLHSKYETVSRLLERLDVKIGPLDMVSVDVSGDVVEIVIDSQLVLYERDTVITESPVVYRNNPVMPTWYEAVVQEGRDGEVGEIYEVIYSEGKEVSRQLVEEVNVDVVETVIERGTLENFAPNDAAVTDIITNEDGTGTIYLENGETVTFHEKRSMRATAYTAGEPGVDGTTASGSHVRVGTVAVDRRVFPFGTKFYIVSDDGMYQYGFSIAEDVGGAIKNDRIDLYFNTLAECNKFGRRNCTVYVLD